MEEVSGGAGEVYFERSKCGARVADEMSPSAVLGASGGLSGMRAGCRLPPRSSFIVLSGITQDCECGFVYVRACVCQCVSAKLQVHGVLQQEQQK